MDRVLIVEDDDNRLLWFRSILIGTPFDVAKTASEGIGLLTQHQYSQIFLDHDLADEHYVAWQEATDRYDEETGYAVAKFLAENPDRSPTAAIIIHSLNPVGSERMFNVLQCRWPRRVDFLTLKRSINDRSN